MFRQVFAAGALALAGTAMGATMDDEKTLAEIDARYQLAVKQNDGDTMARIQAPDMVLVNGHGHSYGGDKLIEWARNRTITWERQDVIDGTRKVRVYGDTAIVTALLWLKGTEPKKGAFEYRVWFSDTYVRRPEGWRYVFGQSSLPLADTPG